MFKDGGIVSALSKFTMQATGLMGTPTKVQAEAQELSRVSRREERDDEGEGEKKRERDERGREKEKEGERECVRTREREEGERKGESYLRSLV